MSSERRQKIAPLSRPTSARCHQFFIALIFGCSSLAAITAIPYAASSIDLRPPPTFTTHRDFVVNENDPIGMRVFRVAVVGGPVTFHIAPGSFKDGSRYFRVDEKTGEFYVKESLKGLGGQDFYFFVFAQVPGSSTKASLECRVRINEVSNDGSSLPSFHPPLGSGHHNFVNSGPRLTSQMSPPRDKPKDTVFELPTTSTTLRPPEKPPADPLNNPRQNETLPVDVMSGSSEQNADFDDDTSSRLMRIFTTILPFFSLVLFVPFVIFVAWVTYKCQRNHVPTRNAIKTFSHKIINNNKSDSSASTTSTTSSSFSSGSTSDYNGALFRTKKSLACKEMSAVSTNRSLLKVSDSEWEFPRHHLKFIHILGEGCFGQVWKCEAVNIGNTGSSQVVAVKTLKQNATQKEKEDLLDELDVMKMLEPHPNVVTLIGCCAEQDPVLLIMEFIPNGTLQSYLRQKRTENGYGNVNGNSSLTSNDLISYVYQIAKGMDYLSSKGIIHRDLAARNILVGYNNVCKIADFGFAKYDQVYERKSEGRLPIRWMAVESLTDFIFTTKSDVWSFGVLMWEIVTLGWTPYPGFSAAEVIKKVCEGQRLEKPEHCKREIFNIMYYCWNENPAKRPTFSELVSLLDKILYSENDYIELDRFPDHGYYNILKPGPTGEKL